MYTIILAAVLMIVNLFKGKYLGLMKCILKATLAVSAVLHRNNVMGVFFPHESQVNVSSYLMEKASSSALCPGGRTDTVV